MARKQTSVAREYTLLALQVIGFQASVDAAINYEVKMPRESSPSTRVYRFDSSAEITGHCIYPEERQGEDYEITVYGREIHSDKFDLTLSDCHVRGEDYLLK